MTTNTRLERIKERAEKASPGPWHYVHGYGFSFHTSQDGPPTLDTAFVTSARDDIPHLLSLITELKANLADVKVDNQNEVQALADALNDSIDNEREARAECERLSVRITNLENGNADLDEILDRYSDALELIKDGGVAQGVLANTEERMLAMCTVATNALTGEKS